MLVVVEFYFVFDILWSVHTSWNMMAWKSYLKNEKNKGGVVDSKNPGIHMYAFILKNHIQDMYTQIRVEGGSYFNVCSKEFVCHSYVNLLCHVCKYAHVFKLVYLFFYKILFLWLLFFCLHMNWVYIFNECWQ